MRAVRAHGRGAGNLKAKFLYTSSVKVAAGSGRSARRNGQTRGEPKGRLALRPAGPRGPRLASPTPFLSSPTTPRKPPAGLLPVCSGDALDDHRHHHVLGQGMRGTSPPGGGNTVRSGRAAGGATWRERDLSRFTARDSNGDGARARARCGPFVRFRPVKVRQVAAASRALKDPSRRATPRTAVCPRAFRRQTWGRDGRRGPRFSGVFLPLAILHATDTVRECLLRPEYARPGLLVSGTALAFGAASAAVHPRHGHPPPPPRPCRPPGHVWRPFPLR